MEARLEEWYSARVDASISIATRGVVRVAGPLSIDELADREVHDEGTLVLTQAPAHVACFCDDAGSSYYAVLLGRALGRRALMDMLYAVAPYKAHGPDRFSRVIDNWQLHDRAKTSAGSESLLLQHAASLKQHWHEFSRHRELYISILQDASEQRRALPVISWQKTGDGVRRYKSDVDRQIVDAMTEMQLPRDTSGAREGATMDTLLGLVAVPYFVPELAKSWRAWQPLVKDGKSNYVGPASVPMMALMHRRALLNSALIRNAELTVGPGAAATNDRLFDATVRA